MSASMSMGGSQSITIKKPSTPKVRLIVVFYYFVHRAQTLPPIESKTEIMRQASAEVAAQTSTFASAP